MDHRLFAYLLHLAPIFFPGVVCLRSVVLWVPEAVRAGSTLQLSCLYDLGSDSLYSIKFYQGDQEFYRFVPKESPPTRVFPLQGVQVDIYKSNNTVVTLSNVQKDLTGEYKCEVSADLPFFHTVIKSAYVVVVEEPPGVPELLVEKTKYTIGERIRANCTSRSSYPAANITFFLNNMQVRNNDLTQLSSYIQTERSGLETSMVEMETVVEPFTFREGRVRLRCLASLYGLYRSSTDVYIQEDTPQLAHVLGTSLRKPGQYDMSNGGGMELGSLLLAVWLATLLACLR